jgi:hypothetical protein
VPRPNAFLFVEPEQHYVIYSSCVMRKIVEAHRRPEHTVVELAGEGASPESIDRALEEADPSAVVMAGHGHPSLFTVECKQPYMSVGDGRVARMSGRVVILNSCLTARLLGPDLVRRGALAYFGSADEFWFYIGEPPCSGRAVESAFLAELQSAASLMDGRTPRQAQADRLRRYEEEVRHWTEGAGKDDPAAPLLARLLEVDRAAAVMLERAAAPPPTPPFIVPLAFTFGSVVFGMATEVPLKRPLAHSP